MSHDRRNNIIRLVCAGVGVPIALAIAGWPSNGYVIAAVSLAGGLVGLLLAFLFEHGIDRRAELNRLTTRVQELEAETENFQRERKIWEHRVAVAKAEAEINAIGSEVYSGMLQEAVKNGTLSLDFSVLLARIQVMQKAKGLDKPIPPPDLS